MDKVIIYPNETGGISILVPCISLESAMRDIPSGKPYRIVDRADLPQSREFRDAWTADFTGAEVKA